ncbi:Vacuolar protein sorting-associated protein 54, chloroplastic [Colletotrichum chlorophyti]|uniref:Vacuolar protein sorting-associated protein 54, chloroplastic n=1 Tax=Colletotrichum chlorophyti TaxID=708187 RepID=A0A1Q8RKP0_9PEZI|nr:Vacuolar protein sorting-associated protein 54, chloroplastic [Colletotrichum chlorophyti]
MYSSPGARKSVDTISPLSPSRTEFPFHRQGQAHPHHTGRRGSTASSIHSIGGSLDTSSTSWVNAVLESGQNAISTLLQPPIVRTGLQPHTSAPASSAHKPPTARDIPPVALTNIPHVDLAEFKPYLSQVGALYEQLRRVKEQEDERPSSSGRRSSRHDDVDTVDESHLRPAGRHPPRRKSSIASITSISSLEGPGLLRRSSSGFSRKAGHGPPPLSTIPNVYFDDDFHLENPRTFDVVSERSEVVPPAPGNVDSKSGSNGSVVAPRKALATNAILQEKLSWYMDTIEVHLINSISTASTTFFTALGSLRELHSEAAESVERIKTLRRELEALDEEIASKGLNIVQKRRRRENVEALNDAVLQLRHIVEGVASCESLVDAGEIDKALTSIDALELLIAGEHDESPEAEPPVLPLERLRDLRGATALQGVNDDLQQLRFRIGKAYETKFQSLLLADLRRHVESVSSREVLLRWSSSSLRARGGTARESSAFPAYLGSTQDLRKAIMPNILGLHRAQHIATAIVAYREAALREIGNLVRRPLPSSNDDDNESMMSASTMSGGRHRTSQEKSSILKRNLQALDPKDAEDLLKTIYIGVAETLRRLTTQVKVLLDVASCLTEEATAAGLKSPPIRSPLASPTPFDREFPRLDASPTFEVQEEIHKAMDIANLVGQAVDVAQDKILRVLKVRSQQSTHLSLSWFLRYFTLNLYFANECEAISGRSGTALKTLVNGHIKDFVQQHGEAEKQKLAQGMESDQWSAKDFNEKDKALLDQVLESSTKDAAAWSEGTKIWEEGPEDEETNGVATSTSETNGSGKEKARGAEIEGETFLLPNSAILCLEGISQFLHLIGGIPSMTTDVATSLITYLQLFNSRCTQLILGAGATRSAGLKNITTRHLALASQALSFIVTLIPHIREFVRRHAGSGAGVSSLMGEFDKVRRLFQEHQNSIYDKLVEIMSGRAAQHSKSMKAIEWDNDEAQSTHTYMETLAKETTTLHRVLTKHLPENAVQMIMGPVFASYKDQFGRVFQAADPKTDAGRNSMLRDVDFFVAKLGKLDGFRDAGDYLKNIINSKEIKRTASPPTEKQADGGSETTASASNSTIEPGSRQSAESGKTESPPEVETEPKQAA